MYADDNIRKSNKPLTNAMYEEFQIPRSKQEAMAADFAGVPSKNARKFRAALVKGGYGLDPTRPSNGGVKLPGVGKIDPERRFINYGGAMNDIPEIQDDFNLDPGLGTSLGGGRTVEMGDYSFGTV